MIFRGRENIHPELGIKILERIIEETKDVAKIEASNITINKDNYYFVVLKNKQQWRIGIQECLINIPSRVRFPPLPPLR